ncbi:MAG: UDP-N-acetylmuramate dehydrogenase [Candidatus Omnitrophica bacterium]|nr:UDP-N-acetylmuramate dehydrogenase [Candidatus Omnitrophota bacterium]
MSLRQLELRKDIYLNKLTSFRIGGKAKLFFVVHSVEDIKLVLSKVSPNFYFLGGGSNLLVNDEDLRTPVITLGKEFDYIKKLDDNIIEVGGATPLAKVLNYTIKEKFCGFENFSGVPARIGGLLIMNASSFGRSISEILEEVFVIDRYGNSVVIKKNNISFSYRTSSLKEEGSIVINAKFKLVKIDRIRDRVCFYLRKRFREQDFSFPSAGCVFKNPKDFSAAYLIEQCGLKGFIYGGAQVSFKHANFIVNRANAKAKDVAGLIDIVKEKVYNKFGIVLEEEIERWEI